MFCSLPTTNIITRSGLIVNFLNSTAISKKIMIKLITVMSMHRLFKVNRFVLQTFFEISHFQLPRTPQLVNTQSTISIDGSPFSQRPNHFNCIRCKRTMVSMADLAASLQLMISKSSADFYQKCPIKKCCLKIIK